METRDFGGGVGGRAEEEEEEERVGTTGFESFRFPITTRFAGPRPAVIVVVLLIAWGFGIEVPLIVAKTGETGPERW